MRQGQGRGAARQSVPWGRVLVSLAVPVSVSVSQSPWVLHGCPSCCLFFWVMCLSHCLTAWSYDCIWLYLQGLAQPSCSPNLGGDRGGAGEYEKETFDRQEPIQRQRDRPWGQGLGGSRGQGHVASRPLTH